MRLGIVSDIHSNAPGLQRALELLGDVDELLCLGDSIFEYRFSNEVVALLRQRGAHVIQGNHEEVFFSPAGSPRARTRRAWTRRCCTTSPSNRTGGCCGSATRAC